MLQRKLLQNHGLAKYLSLITCFENEHINMFLNALTKCNSNNLRTQNPVQQIIATFIFQQLLGYKDD